jgi:hypothetical protein
VSYESELAGLRKAFDEWTSVGHPNPDQEMFILAQLIERYPEKARQMLADRDADTP